MYAEQISVCDSFTDRSLKEDRSRPANFHVTFPKRAQHIQIKHKNNIATLANRIIMINLLLYIFNSATV